MASGTRTLGRDDPLPIFGLDGLGVLGLCPTMVDCRTGLGSGSNSWVLCHVLKVIPGYLWSGGSFHLSGMGPTVGNSVAVRGCSCSAIMFSWVVYIKVMSTRLIQSFLGEHCNAMR